MVTRSGPVGEPLAQGTMAGLVDAYHWEAELDWIGAAGEGGIILFENVAKSRGQLQDRLRKDGFQRYRRQCVW